MKEKALRLNSNMIGKCHTREEVIATRRLRVIPDNDTYTSPKVATSFTWITPSPKVATLLDDTPAYIHGKQLNHQSQIMECKPIYNIVAMTIARKTMIWFLPLI
jgi:hypothetical protein